MPDNTEIFRRALEAFDRGDRDAWVAVHHEDCELVPSTDWPEADMVRGPEANWSFYVKVTEPFAERRYSDSVEFEDLGDDRILAHQLGEVRGRASGAAVELDYWVRVTFSDGKIVREEWFATRP